MPLETATYISDLEPSNPAGTDQLAQGDDHIRMLKAVLQATFPNITGPVTVDQDTLNATTGAIVPVGLITLWYGSSGTIPDGWALCNGATVALSEGVGTIVTPNLVDRVVVGAGTIAAQGATAGSATSTATSSAAGAHSHTIAGGAHTHTATALQATAGGSVSTTTARFDPSGAGNNAVTGATFTPGAAHTHTVTVDSATHSHTMDDAATHTHSTQVSTIQPVYGLHYIIKV